MIQIQETVAIDIYEEEMQCKHDLSYNEYCNYEKSVSMNYLSIDYVYP